ncbi:hypothetical protein L0Y65_04950 [Candidatus Micrarchaeota archaeon]|nr:hypothetical protein [Candidatus Micrarchaeota archaeon]
MDDEEEEVMPRMAPPQMQQMPPGLRFAALAMTGEFLLIFGVLFVLLGAAGFVTDLLRIKGSGEMLVGLMLCIAAAALLRTSAKQMPMVRVVQGPPPTMRQHQEKTKADGSSYR